MEASSFGVSLKDPVSCLARFAAFDSPLTPPPRAPFASQLTLARIKTPIRSASCTHISCFDAEVYFMINEQTPTWTCPICSKVLRVEDLIYDGCALLALFRSSSALR